VDAGKSQRLKSSEGYKSRATASYTTRKRKSRTQEPVPPVCAEEWSPGPTERAELGQEKGRAREGAEVKSAGSEGAGTRW